MALSSPFFPSVECVVTNESSKLLSFNNLLTIASQNLSFALCVCVYLCVCVSLSLGVCVCVNE